MKLKFIIISWLIFVFTITLSIAKSSDPPKKPIQDQPISSQGILDSLMYPSQGESHRLSGVKGIKPGEILDLGEIKNPGVIRHMWFTAQSKLPHRVIQREPRHREKKQQSEAEHRKIRVQPARQMRESPLPM